MLTDDEARSEETEEEISPEEEAGEASGQRDSEEEDFDAAQAKALIKKLRVREKELDKQLKSQGKQLKNYERSQQSEKEQLESRIEELTEQLSDYEKKESRWQADRRRNTFIEKVNLPNPRLAYASLAEVGVEVEWDEDDRPTNLPAIRKTLKEEFPREFGTGSADGGRREEDEGAPSSMNDMIRARAGRAS